VNVFAPESTSFDVVEDPFIVNPPEPLSTPDRVSVVLEAGLNHPPVPAKVMLRADVKVAVVYSVPAPMLTTLVASPRLLSASILREPPFIVTPPVNVPAPFRYSVPAVCLVMPPAPEITPL